MTTQRVDVARLSELLDKATPGPWAATVNGHVKRVGGEIVLNPQMNIGDKRHDNADLIAEGINALPALLQQLADLQERLNVTTVMGRELVQQQDAQRERANAAESKIAEQATEIESLRADNSAVHLQILQVLNRAEAAERAREGATGLLRRVHGSLYLLDLPHREFGGVTDKTATDIAAFLAANGGRDD